MKRLIARMQYAHHTRRMRWASRRLRESIGFDMAEAMERADAARDVAYARALLIDPCDADGAKSTGEHAAEAEISRAFAEQRARKVG